MKGYGIDHLQKSRIKKVSDVTGRLLASHVFHSHSHLSGRRPPSGVEGTGGERHEARRPNGRGKGNEMRTEGKSERSERHLGPFPPVHTARLPSLHLTVPFLHLTE